MLGGGHALLVGGACMAGDMHEECKRTVASYWNAFLLVITISDCPEEE